MAWLVTKVARRRTLHPVSNFSSTNVCDVELWIRTPDLLHAMSRLIVVCGCSPASVALVA